MKYKLLVICIVMSICCCGCEKESNGNKVNSEELIEQIFDVSGVDYMIIEETNELSDKEYGGSYCVVLKVEKEDVASFITKLEGNYYKPEDVEAYSAPIKNVYGKELGENDTFYTRHSSVRRKLEGVNSMPKTCGFYIICSEKETGDYEIKMEYAE